MSDPNQAEKHRLRLTFAKKSQIKYIAHLDLALAWERALRRAQIPLAYSQGFNPRPKMQVASGLPLGTTGQKELLDIITTTPVDPDDVLKRVSAALPMGIELSHVEIIDWRTPALPDLVSEAVYAVIVETELSRETLEERVAEVLEAKTLIQWRRRKKRDEKFDLRPLIYELSVETVVDGDATFGMLLAAGQRGNLRPEAVLKALELDENWFSIDRRLLILEKR